MPEDADFKNGLLWAESIIQQRQHSVKQQQTTTSNLKIALYVAGAIVIIGILIYIIQRAYRVPDPLSILDEVKSMISQTTFVNV